MTGNRIGQALHSGSEIRLVGGGFSNRYVIAKTVDKLLLGLESGNISLNSISAGGVLNGTLKLGHLSALGLIIVVGILSVALHLFLGKSTGYAGVDVGLLSLYYAGAGLSLKVRFTLFESNVMYRGLLKHLIFYLGGSEVTLAGCNIVAESLGNLGKCYAANDSEIVNDSVMSRNFLDKALLCGLGKRSRGGNLGYIRVVTKAVNEVLLYCKSSYVKLYSFATRRTSTLLFHRLKLALGLLVGLFAVLGVLLELRG